MVISKLPNVLSFEWDQGNTQKSWLKHNVTTEEAEEAFGDTNRMIFEDIQHSTAQEKRYILFAKIQKKKKLVIIFGHNS